VPAQQSSNSDRLRIEIIGEGDATAHRVDILAGEFARAGHVVSVRRPDAPPSDSLADVVHAHGWAAITAVGVPREAALIASLDPPGPGLDPFAVTIGQAYDRIIAPSSDEVRDLLAVGLRRDRIAVVPDGVDPVIYNAGPKGPGLRAEPRSRRVLCVLPALVPELLFDAMIALRRVPDARLYVAGGPPAPRLRRDPDAREVAAAARRIGVASRIVLVGRVPPERRPDLYRSADLVICTGEPDSARVALEAMACAVPVAAFAEGAVADIITHGVCGVLVERGNSYALAEAVRSLLASEPRRYALGVAGLSRVQERFTWSRVAEQTEGIYRSVLADRHDRPSADLAGGVVGDAVLDS